MDEWINSVFLILL